MSNPQPRMTNLFLQLGLPATPEAIAQFILTHQLPADVAIGAAAIWDESQRQFLSEQLGADGDWSTIVDELNEALHADAVKAENQA